MIIIGKGGATPYFKDVCIHFNNKASKSVVIRVQQNPKLMEAYQMLRRMTFSKQINTTVIRAVRARLERMLENKEAQYKYWRENIAHKLSPTRKRDITRVFEKTIQAYKIIIFELTPYFDRAGDPPTFVNKKPKRV